MRECFVWNAGRLAVQTAVTDMRRFQNNKPEVSSNILKGCAEYVVISARARIQCIAAREDFSTQLPCL